MATIKAIEASSIHQIQSGQVIVDLCSVVKELVENGLDAGATSIEVRFKNQGLDSIEVQDNGSGISPDNYESVALKHYTSKLSTYADLTTLETFGFRGEALSSLCALSRFTVTTCRQAEAPRGKKLEFETSGKLKGTSMVAAQKGTSVSVENLFHNLPVRRRELERNIKREWGKVISLLNQYACIQTGVKFTVSQTPNKGKRIVLFSTKGNKTTRDNIVNVFGAKTVSALVALDLKLELEATSGPSQRWSTQEGGGPKVILVKGYVSRPNHGEGRQTPDRQMFYVNSRPCGLPQFAKVFNEVYKSFNSSQSPFIFADIQLDTHLYDVNVSPDKRTILLHDQTRMLENLRDSLTELFEKQDYTLPMSQIASFKQPAFKKPTITQQETEEDQSAGTSLGETLTLTEDIEDVNDVEDASKEDVGTPGHRHWENMAAAKRLARDAPVSDLVPRGAERKISPREEFKSATKVVTSPTTERAMPVLTSQVIAEDHAKGTTFMIDRPDRSRDVEVIEEPAQSVAAVAAQDGEDFLVRLAKLKRSFLPESLQDEMPDSETPEDPVIPALTRSPKPSDNAPLSVSNARPPKRSSQEVATITVGDHTVTSIIGNPPKRLRMDETAVEQRRSQKLPKPPQSAAPLPSFNGRLTQIFAAGSVKRQTSTGFEALQTEEADNDDESQDSEGDDPDPSPQFAEIGEKRGKEGEEGDNEEQQTSSQGSSPLFVEQDEDVPFPTSPRAEDDDTVDETDGEYDDEEDKEAQEAREDMEVEAVMKAAGEAGPEPGEENLKRTTAFLKGAARKKYSTNGLLQRLKIDVEALSRRLRLHETQSNISTSVRDTSAFGDFENGLEAENAEETLALAIHKGDFGKMKIVGQFNLGFVLAVRPSSTSTPSSSTPTATQQKPEDDELFIIDQHASDEKFNFERLQATTIVQSQRLVRPKPLELTAVEEEVVIENQSALEKNGFVVAVDESGDEPVGSRCQLLALPLSRETTFTLADLEELISLLGDNPTTTDGREESGGGYVPRPSKVRKMFAMRACRSSIMIGKALSRQQMERIVRHMGEMEKPWNCPHGRPTMRHLCGLGGAWDERGWREWETVDDGNSVAGTDRTTNWAGYIRQKNDGT